MEKFLDEYSHVGEYEIAKPRNSCCAIYNHVNGKMQILVFIMHERHASSSDDWRQEQ